MSAYSKSHSIDVPACTVVDDDDEVEAAVEAKEEEELDAAATPEDESQVQAREGSSSGGAISRKRSSAKRESAKKKRSSNKRYITTSITTGFSSLVDTLVRNSHSFISNPSYGAFSTVPVIHGHTHEEETGQIVRKRHGQAGPDLLLSRGLRPPGLWLL